MNTISMKLQADELIRLALQEDISSEDVTTNSVMKEAVEGEVQLICKQDGIVAGLDVFKRVFELLDEEEVIPEPVNPVKAKADCGAVEFELASEDTIKAVTGAEVGFAGPIGIKTDYLFIDQEVVDQRNVIVGANKTGYHIQNANFGRDFEGQVGDFRNVQEGDKCPKCGQPLEIMRGVEVGHIFKLGTKYSEAMNATFIDENGKNVPFVMGCYGIGVTRTMASIIEQHHDENGITWPLAIAPYHVVVVPVNIKKEEHMEAAENIYNELQDMGVEVLLDDRDERAGVKFKDSELIGIPMRITVGKDIVDGKVEFKLRKEADKEIISVDEVLDRVKAEFAKNNVKLG